MMDAHSVITQAAAKYVEKLAVAYNCTLRRMYERLGNDNPYPKAKRLCREIGRLNPDGLRAIRADFNAMCDEVLDEGKDHARPPCADVHRECAEAIQARMDGKPLRVQRREAVQAIAKFEHDIKCIDLLIDADGVVEHGVIFGGQRKA